MNDLNLIIPIRKIDEEKRLIIGRAVQEVPDKSGEIMDYESAKPAFEAWSKSFVDATDGMSKGNLRVMHGKTVAGKLVDLGYNDTDKAIDVVAKVVDDNEWRKCLEGVYTGFSVGGSYAKKWIDPTNPELKRYTPRVSELSLVDTPCIPTARFYDLVKADGVVEQREFKTPEPTPEPVAPAYESYGERMAKFNVNHDKIGRFAAAAGVGAAGIGLAAAGLHYAFKPKFASSEKGNLRYVPAGSPSKDRVLQHKISRLGTGDYAKIERGGERFWVKLGDTSNGNYSGSVDNQLVNTKAHGLKYGDKVSFGADEIYDAFHPGARKSVYATELTKFNQNHDQKGRFSSSSSKGTGEKLGGIAGTYLGMIRGANLGVKVGQAVHRKIARGLLRSTNLKVKPGKAAYATARNQARDLTNVAVASKLRMNIPQNKSFYDRLLNNETNRILASQRRATRNIALSRIIGGKGAAVVAAAGIGTYLASSYGGYKVGSYIGRKIDHLIGNKQATHTPLKKANPNHDPSNGEFSSGGGSSSPKPSDDGVKTPDTSKMTDAGGSGGEAGPKQATPKEPPHDGAAVSTLPASYAEHKQAQDHNAGYNAITSDVIPEQRGGPIGYAAGIGLGAASLAPAAYASQPGLIGNLVRHGDQTTRRVGAAVGRFAGNAAGRISAAAVQGVIAGSLGLGASATRKIPNVSSAIKNAATAVRSTRVPGDIAGRAMGYAGEAAGRAAARVYTGGTGLLGDAMTHATGSPLKAALLLGLAGGYLGSQTLSPKLQAAGEYVQTFFPRRVQKTMVDDILRKYNHNHDQKGRFSNRDAAIVGGAIAGGALAGFAGAKLATMKKPRSTIVRAAATAARAVNDTIVKPTAKDAAAILAAAGKKYAAASPTKKLIYVAVAAAGLKLAKPLLNDAYTYWNNLHPKLEVDNYGAKLHIQTKDKQGNEKKLKTYTYSAKSGNFEPTEDFGAGGVSTAQQSRNIPGMPSGTLWEQASRYANTPRVPFRDPSNPQVSYTLAPDILKDRQGRDLLYADRDNGLGSQVVKRQEALASNIDPSTYRELPNARYEDMLMAVRRDDQNGHMSRRQKGYLMGYVYGLGRDLRDENAIKQNRMYEVVTRDVQNANRNGGYATAAQRTALTYLREFHPDFNNSDEGRKQQLHLREIMKNMKVLPPPPGSAGTAPTPPSPHSGGGGQHGNVYHDAQGHFTDAAHAAAPQPEPTPTVKAQDEHVSSIAREDAKDKAATEFATRRERPSTEATNEAERKAMERATRLATDLTDEDIARMEREESRFRKVYEANELSKSILAHTFDEGVHPRLPGGQHGGGEFATGNGGGKSSVHNAVDTSHGLAGGLAGRKADRKVKDNQDNKPQQGSAVPRIAENLAAYGAADVAGRIAQSVLGNTPAGKLVQLGRVGAKFTAEVTGGAIGGGAAGNVAQRIAGPAEELKQGAGETVGRLIGGMGGYSVGAAGAALLGLPSGPGAIATGIAGGAIGGTAGEEIGGFAGRAIDRYGPEVSARIVDRFFG